MSKKKKRLRYLKRLEEQKNLEEEQEDISTAAEEEIVDTDINQNEVDSPKENIFNFKKAEKFLLIFIVVFILFLIFIPGEIINKISILINKILP